MIVAGQIALLTAFVAAGFSAFASLAGTACDRRGLQRAGTVSGAACLALLTAVSVILIWALLVRDFRFAYVAENSDRLLALVLLALGFLGRPGRIAAALVLAVERLGDGLPVSGPARGTSRCGRPAFGILMAYLAFLLAVMVFGADPLQPSLDTPREGTGLSPLLQHPVMLVHPPIVFLGYAGWAIPFALAAAALVTGRLDVGLGRTGASLVALLLGRAGLRDPAGRRLGLRRTRLGRLLELGPGGKRLADSLDRGHGPDSRVDGLAVSRRAQEDVPGIGHRHLRAVQFRHLPHPQRHLQQSARLQSIAHRLDVPGLDGRLGGRRVGPAAGPPRPVAAAAADPQFLDPRSRCWSWPRWPCCCWPWWRLSARRPSRSRRSSSAERSWWGRPSTTGC